MARKILIAVLLLVLVPALSVARGSGGKKGKTGAMSVHVREVFVRTSPNYLGPKAGALTYGSQVEVISREGNWCQIASPSGWVPDSALTKHKLKVGGGKTGTGASQDEIALAGKGFNPKVEAQYKKDNPQMVAAYAKVDRMEGFGATEAELKTFARAGKLH